MNRLLILVRLLALTAFTFHAHAADPPLEGKVVGNVYQNKRLGWEMKIPQGWATVSASEVARLESKGKKIIEKHVEAPVDMTFVRLLHLQKDRYNRFMSTAQKHDPDDGAYKDQQEFLFKTVVGSLRSQKIELDATRRTETLDGLVFEALHIKVYASDRSKLLFEQVMYDRLIGDNSVTITVMYNNDADRRAIETAVKNSKFSRTK
jgi:hypothetical protein